MVVLHGSGVLRPHYNVPREQLLIGRRAHVMEDFCRWGAAKHVLSILEIWFLAAAA